ncbi:hypothetical protein [Croceitalea rosinachiae]|uniref:MerC mercury resistance protein n=1 Tax=Croceitalea rosinachiae TaxID=3075596 RepID=A0ABU3ADW2_9FLAO|nr:hypothetical protein [Croceitalea sp. F388]MDT0607081.1 hypothetical protein [Croceitalea sp. F388]
MDLSRKTKNGILIALNFTALVIQLVKWHVLKMDPNISIKTWIFLVPLILLINIISLSNKKSAELIHASLFLATGAIIAFTLVPIFKGQDSVVLIEYLWLILALAGAVLHYSKSKNDIYQNK